MMLDDFPFELASFVPAFRNSDPHTCEAAANDAAKRASYSRRLALQILRGNPAGLTDFELAELSGFQQTSIGKRRGELRDAGLVVDSGERRRAPSGSMAIVWRAA